MLHDARYLLPLSRRECAALLRTHRVGRVVFTERALPAVLPVAYGVLGDDVVIRTQSDNRLYLAARGGVLAFEVDDIDPETRTGWSVVVTGVPTEVHDPVEVAAVGDLFEPWLPGPRDVILRIPATVVTGRRLVSTEADPVIEASG